MGSEMCIRDRKYSVKYMRRKILLPAVVDIAVRKQVTKRRAGMWWDREVEKARKEVGGSQDEMLFAGEGAGYKTKGRDATKEKGKWGV